MAAAGPDTVGPSLRASGVFGSCLIGHPSTSSSPALAESVLSLPLLSVTSSTISLVTTNFCRSFAITQIGIVGTIGRWASQEVSLLAAIIVGVMTLGLSGHTLAT